MTPTLHTAFQMRIAMHLTLAFLALLFLTLGIAWLAESHMGTVATRYEQMASEEYEVVSHVDEARPFSSGDGPALQGIALRG
jgi:hypothetical protein